MEEGESGTGDYPATLVLQLKSHRGLSTVRGDPFPSHGICCFRSLLRSSILKPLRVSDLPYLPGLLLPLSFMFLTPWFNCPSLSQPQGHKLSSRAVSQAPAHRFCSKPVLFIFRIVQLEAIYNNQLVQLHFLPGSSVVLLSGYNFRDKI